LCENHDFTSRKFINDVQEAFALVSCWKSSLAPGVFFIWCNATMKHNLSTPSFPEALMIQHHSASLALFGGNEKNCQHRTKMKNSIKPNGRDCLLKILIPVTESWSVATALETPPPAVVLDCLPFFSLFSSSFALILNDFETPSLALGTLPKSCFFVMPENLTSRSQSFPHLHPGLHS
jgi:hypothetical protein